MEETTTSIEENVPTQNVFPLFRATWEEWGRATRNCAGMGLCNFNICWWQDPCPLVEPNPDQTYVEFQKVSEVEGLLTIFLSTTSKAVALEYDEDASFYVDDQLINEKVQSGYNKKSIVAAGKYEFDPEIGEIGGYSIPVQLEVKSVMSE